jgi:gliding motility-associated-like protein
MEYLAAPSLGIFDVSGRGTNELLSKGPASFQDFEDWLVAVEYVNTSANPTPGERRISVIGYFNFGERTDTAVAHINVYLINADSGGVWFSNPIVELDYRNSGDYLYIVSDSCSADTARINVRISMWPDVSLEGPDQLCADEEGILFLDGEVSQIDSLLWNTGSSDTTIAVDSTGWYGLELFYGEDCRWSDSIFVEVNDELLEADSTSLCTGDTVIWRGQTITAGGRYEVRSTGDTGCDTLFSLNVEELSPVEITEELALCEGASRMRYGVEIDSVGEYRFTLPSSAACDTQVVIRVEAREGIVLEVDGIVCSGERYDFRGEAYDPGGPYEVLSEVEDGCDTLWQLSVIEERYASLEILAPDRLCAPRAEIEITGIPTSELSNSSWSTGATGIRTTIEDPGSYSWEGESINGCVYRVEKEVAECSRCEVAIPNVFSPNGDNVNDIFMISSSCDLIDFRAQIFDRWGKQIVESRQPDAIWNGRDYQPGAYVYRISYKEETEQGQIEKIEHGTVTLVR